MLGIKSVIYQKNGINLTIIIKEISKIIYRDISATIDNELVLEYLRTLFCIIDEWKTEYIDTRAMDIDSWRLSIIYIDGSRREHCGKSNYPINFEAFERINLKLISEVQNG